MYTFLHRFVSALYYRHFQHALKKDPFLSNSADKYKTLSLDYFNHIENGFGLFKIKFEKFPTSDLFGFNSALKVYDYKFIKDYYEQNKDNFVYCSSKSCFVENAIRVYSEYDKKYSGNPSNYNADLARNITIYSVEEVEKLREYVYSILDNGRIEPYNQQYKEMFFYTVLLGLFPELFMGTALPYYSIERCDGLFENIKLNRIAEPVITDSFYHNILQYTARGLVARMKEIQQTGNNTLFVTTLYSHLIYRLHLVNNFLLHGLNSNLGSKDMKIKRVSDIFRKYVLKKLSKKYAFAIERLVKFHNLTYKEIQYMVLQDVIDYLQLLGLTLSFIGRVPEKVLYSDNARKKEKIKLISKFDINLWEYSSRFAHRFDEPEEFYRDFFRDVFDVVAPEGDKETIGKLKFLAGTVHKSSKFAGYQLLQNDCFLPGKDLNPDFCRELRVPREMLEVYVRKFEAGILYSMNSIYLPEYEDFTKLLPEHLYNYFPQFKQNKVYPATYPLMTPYAVMFLDTVKNGMFMFMGYKDKYPEQWDQIVSKGEYLKAKLNLLIVPWIPPSNLKSFIPPPDNYIGMDIVLLNDYVKAVLYTNYDKISEEGKKEFYTFFEDLLIAPRENEVAKDIHMKYDPENFVDSFHDYVYLNPISCGVTPSGIEEIILERQRKLEEKRKNITDSMRDSTEFGDGIGIKIDFNGPDGIKSRSKQVEVVVENYGKNRTERYNLDYYNLETIISDELNSIKTNATESTVVEDTVPSTPVFDVVSEPTVPMIEQKLETEVEKSVDVVIVPESESGNTETTVTEESYTPVLTNIISVETNVSNKEEIMMNQDTGRLDRIESEIASLTESLKNLEKIVETLANTVEQTNKRMDQTNSRVDDVISRLDKVVASIQQLGTKMGDHEIRIGTMENEIERLGRRVANLEKKAEENSRIDEDQTTQSTYETTTNSTNQYPDSPFQSTVVRGHNINLSGATVHGSVVINIGDNKSKNNDVLETTDEITTDDKSSKATSEDNVSKTHQLLEPDSYNKLVEDVTNKVVERIITELDRAVTSKLSNISNVETMKQVDSNVVESVLDVIKNEVVTKDEFETKMVYLDTGINAMLDSIGKLDVLVGNLADNVSTLADDLSKHILKTKKQENNYESYEDNYEQMEEVQQVKESSSQSSDNLNTSTDTSILNLQNNILDGIVSPTNSSNLTSSLDSIFQNLDVGLEMTKKILSEAEQQEGTDLQGFV